MLSSQIWNQELEQKFKPKYSSTGCQLPTMWHNCQTKHLLIKIYSYLDSNS